MRDHYEYKTGVFADSLLKDFLLQNGLSVWKDESTRDIICLEFNYGSRSYADEEEHLQKILAKATGEFDGAVENNDKYLQEKYVNKITLIKNLMETAKSNESKYQKMSKEEIRTLFYNDGVWVTYITKNRHGEEIKRERIHYKMLFRSTGKAKKGSCMFIRDKLYKKAKHFLYMGLKLPKRNAPIVEASAYIPLTASGIVGTIEINPKNILVLKDVKRSFITNIVSVETDSQKHCIAKRIDEYELFNTLFDGEAILDESLFPTWGSGFILLRHHFFKAAAFKGKIQKFFRDYFGEEYETATVVDMFGQEHLIKDIQMVTTDNAMKWLKFDVTYDYWCDRVNENGNKFGIVKTAHPSKLGNMQKMSYQMVNSLMCDKEKMDAVFKNSVDYVEKLKNDNEFFLEYLKKHSNFSNDYDVLVALCDQDRDFFYCDYFKNRKKSIIGAYVMNMKNGAIMQEADNLTIVGSPYALLLYAATGNPDDVDLDNTFSVEKGTIQCYTERFADGEYLAGFRSPFNGKYNLSYLHNVYDARFEMYFDFGKNIIAVNMIGTDFQDRNNGLTLGWFYGNIVQK